MPDASILRAVRMPTTSTLRPINTSRSNSASPLKVDTPVTSKYSALIEVPMYSPTVAFSARRSVTIPMFVSKLLATGKGQCNSLPRLYLILAEEIGAEAFLSLWASHSYIKFKDEEENWYNVELTNGMFTTESMILQSGFIKSEALQNGIYMQQMTEKQLLSQLYSDFAQGYARKFGYNPFVKKVIDKALELYPNSISANQMNSNYLTIQFEYVAKQVGINPRNRNDLQNIRNYPNIIKLLNNVNTQYNKVDDLGFEFMSAEAYQNWLASLKETKQKQDSEDMKKQFNIKLKKTFKN